MSAISPAISSAWRASKSREIAQYASQKETAIREKLAGDPNNSELQAELAKWEEGGSYRTALHTLSGAASGGLGGALGALAVAGAADPLNVLQEKIVSLLEQQGMSGEAAVMAAQALAQGAALGIGSLAGGTSGAASALTADTNNRQSTLAEKNRLKPLQKDRSATQQQRLADAACFLTHCSAELSDINPKKAALVEQERRGQSYASEITDLSSTGLYTYGKLDLLTDASSRFADRGSLELVSAATGAMNMGYLVATNGPGGNVQMPSDPWDDTGGKNGPSAGTALAFPSVICLLPLCVTRLNPVVLGGPGYIPQNALLSGGQDNGNLVENTGSSVINEADKKATKGTNAVTVSNTIVTSEGTANAATSQGLKGQLTGQNLSNIAAQDSRLAAAVNGSGKLNPNFSIGSRTNYEANQLGKIWVGEGAVRTSDGSGMISADGTRVYRFPTEKNSSFQRQVRRQISKFTKLIRLRDSG